MCYLSFLYKVYNEIVTLKNRTCKIVPFIASAKVITSIIREINLHQSPQCCCLCLKLSRYILRDVSTILTHWTHVVVSF